jgi:hypothetical protein
MCYSWALSKNLWQVGTGASASLKSAGSATLMFPVTVQKYIVDC